jgi:hypothetical protein
MVKYLRDLFARLNIHFFGPFFGFHITKQSHSRPTTLKARDVFANRSIRAIEIGCYTAVNTADILRVLNVREMVIIDPYEKYSDFPDYNDNLLAKASLIAKKRLLKFNCEIKWVKEYSSNAIPYLKDYFDFIYIDGNHEYEYVYEDMVNYFQILSPGGIMGGHDISNVGVHKAFFKFLSKYSTLDFGIKEPDWFIQKNF